MDGFAGYKTAAAAIAPDAVTVMDPFHVVALAGAKLDLIPQRLQQQTLGRRRHRRDPLHGIRRLARTRIQLLSARHHARLTSVLDADEHLAGNVAYVIYQKIIAAYADTNRRRGQTRDEQADRFPPPRRTHRAGGDRPTRPHPLAPPRRHPGLLRPPRLQRPHRSHQRPPASPAPQRPRIPKPRPLPNPLTTAQRRPPRTRQCILNFEEPRKYMTTRFGKSTSAICNRTGGLWVASCPPDRGNPDRGSGELGSGRTMTPPGLVTKI